VLIVVNNSVVNYDIRPKMPIILGSSIWICLFMLSRYEAVKKHQKSSNIIKSKFKKISILNMLNSEARGHIS